MGYTLLQLNNKKILLFSDIHDGVNYCSNVDSQFISQYLYNHSGKNKILLEEAVKDPNLKLKELWPDAKHTQQLKQLSIKFQKEIISTDIRPLLIPFSWELANSNKTYYNMPLRKYLFKLGEFFNTNSSMYKKYIKDTVCNDVKIQEHYDILSEKFHEIKNIKNSHRTIGYFKENDLNLMYNINHLLDLIMEFYMYILIVCGTNTTYIIHTGIAHSSRMIDFFTQYYNYEIIKQEGVNEIKYIPESPMACIYLPTDVKDMFNKKVYLF